MPDFIMANKDLIIVAELAIVCLGAGFLAGEHSGFRRAMRQADRALAAAAKALKPTKNV